MLDSNVHKEWRGNIDIPLGSNKWGSSGIVSEGGGGGWVGGGKGKNTKDCLTVTGMLALARQSVKRYK